MVILFATPYFSTREQWLKGSGYEVYLRRVSSALKDMGHTPLIVSLGSEDMQYTENGIEIFFAACSEMPLKIKNKKLRLFYERLNQSHVINKKIARLLSQREIDMIQFPSLNGLSLCYFGRTPAVMRMSSYSKIYNNHEDFDQEKINVWGFCERLASRRCNSVFAPSNVIAEIFSKDIQRNVSVIESPYCNDLMTFDESVYRDKLLGKKYFLFFGRLVADKGILVIAECLQRFMQENPQYYFVCCGEDAYINGKRAASILRKASGQYRDRFLHISSLSHAVLYPIIQHADFVISPSWIENLANACIEAMYFGKVVIGTDGASYEQLISDGESGLLCIPGDPESLLRKMNEAVSLTEDQKREMGKKARQRIESLAPKYVVKKLVRYYQYVMEGIGK